MSDNEKREYVPTTEQVRAGFAEDPAAEYNNPVGYSPRPAERAFDRWLAAHDAEVAAEAEPLTIDRDKLRGALLNVLCNASNYPAGVRSHVLGRDMGPLVNKVTDAVIAHLSAQEAATEVEWGVRIPGENVAYTQIFDNEWAAKESAASDKSWCSTAPRVIETRRVTRTPWQEVPADE